MVAPTPSLSQDIMQPAPTDIPGFTIWYRSIRSMSDSQLLPSSLVNQLYAKEVYFCSFVT